MEKYLLPNLSNDYTCNNVTSRRFGVIVTPLSRYDDTETSALTLIFACLCFKKSLIIIIIIIIIITINNDNDNDNDNNIFVRPQP